MSAVTASAFASGGAADGSGGLGAGGSMAVKMALIETFITNENKKALEREGEADAVDRPLRRE